MANYVRQTWVDGSGGGTPVSAARLAVMEDGIFAAHYPPCARVYHSANQACATGATTALAFNSERFDTDAIHDTVTNNTRLTCKTAGAYQISGSVLFETVAAGSYRLVSIRLNGTTAIAVDLRPPTSAGDAWIPISTYYDLAVNQYVELCASHDRGSNLNVLASGNSSPEFMMVRVGSS